MFVYFWLHSVLVVACGLKDQTHILCIEQQILNHWTTRQVPMMLCLSIEFSIVLH